jgi:hypothetical protein
MSMDVIDYDAFTGQSWTTLGWGNIQMQADVLS